jgi:hypothetical protein
MFILTETREIESYICSARLVAEKQNCFFYVRPRERYLGLAPACGIRTPWLGTVVTVTRGELGGRRGGAL